MESLREERISFNSTSTIPRRKASPSRQSVTLKCCMIFFGVWASDRDYKYYTCTRVIIKNTGTSAQQSHAIMPETQTLGVVQLENRSDRTQLIPADKPIRAK